MSHVCLVLRYFMTKCVHVHMGWCMWACAFYNIFDRFRG